MLGLSGCGSSDDSSDSDAKSDEKSSASKAEAEGEETEGGGYGESEEQTEGEKANEEFKNKVSDEELLKGLKAGGYVVFVRHGQTNKDWADQASKDLDLENCATQRSLSEKGWQQARTIGAAFTKAQIPVGEVTASEYCRAWQTADLAFGKYKEDAALNFAKAEEYTDEQVKEMADGIKPFLTTKPAAGTNNIVVGHDDVFESATGIYPAPQGISYVAVPKGDSFELIAKLSPEDWKKLAG
ncbi:MAG: histidine phosphatase family protein [Micrococcales bacterium]|nr:MAG: histidine phosphatase family protein [Micrococcales bacterium]